MQKDMLVVQLFRNGSYGCLPVRSGRTAPAPKGRRGGACLLTSVHEEFLGEVAQLGGPSSWVCSCIPSPTQPGDPWRSVATRAASPGRLVQDAQPQVPAPRVEGEHSGPITARQHHRHRRKKTAALRSRGVRSARATPLACWRRCPGRGRRRCAAARCGLRRGRRQRRAAPGCPARRPGGRPCGQPRAPAQGQGERGGGGAVGHGRPRQVTGAGGRPS